jgi:hypothetical protein
MPAEINRVWNAIDAHLDCYGDPQKHVQEFGELAGAMTRTVFLARTRLADRCKVERRRPTEEEIALDKRCEELGAALSLIGDHEQDVPRDAEAIKALAKEALVCRRATYPLDPPKETPWDDPPTPEEALEDDADMYSFAIYDDMIDPIYKLLPPLYKLAVEDF